jgi:hypothetical protein
MKNRKMLAAGACAASLAFPAGAGAMLPPDDSGPVASDQPATTVVREVHTGGDETVAIALGAAALAVAMGGTGYVALTAAARRSPSR